LETSSEAPDFTTQFTLNINLALSTNVSLNSVLSVQSIIASKHQTIDYSQVKLNRKNSKDIFYPTKAFVDTAVNLDSI
jgi:hypothetical protein